MIFSSVEGKDTYGQEPESVFFLIANRELNVAAFFELGKK